MELGTILCQDWSSVFMVLPERREAGCEVSPKFSSPINQWTLEDSLGGEFKDARVVREGFLGEGGIHREMIECMRKTIQRA